MLHTIIVCYGHTCSRTHASTQTHFHITTMWMVVNKCTNATKYVENMDIKEYAIKVLNPVRWGCLDFLMERDMPASHLVPIFGTGDVPRHAVGMLDDGRMVLSQHM